MLVITIVVLIILATVAINVAFDDKGIIEAAKEAKDSATNSMIRDQEDMKELAEILANGLAEEEIKEEITNATPVVNLNGYAEGSWTNKDVVINLSSSGSIEKYQCSKDNGAWEDCSNQITINTDGEVTYKFRATTTGGLTTNETKTYVIKRDTIEPSFSIRATYIVDESSRVDILDLSDTGSGICKCSYYYKLSSDSDSNYILSYSGVEQSYTIKNLTGYSSYNIKVTVTDNAGNTEEQITTAGTSCFTAGTKVLTEDGLKNIEDIKIGDKVYALNIDNNQRELKTVTSLFKGKSDEIYKITVNGKIIEATPKHQFYVVDKGWIRAYDLEEGDMLVAKDNQSLIIEKIEHKRDVENPVDVYNLTVEGYHNYLITELEILVHNTASKPW